MTFSFFHFSLWAGVFTHPALIQLTDATGGERSGDVHTSLTTLLGRFGLPNQLCMYLGLTWGLLLVGHLEQVPKPPQLTAFNAKEQWLYSKLLLSHWASHPISQPPWRGNSFQPLVPCTAVHPVDTNKSNPLSQSLVTEPMLCVVVSLFLLGTSQFLPGNTNLGDINTQVFFLIFIFHGELMDLFVTCFGVMAPNKITHRIIWHTNPATTVRRVFKEGEIFFFLKNIITIYNQDHYALNCPDMDPTSTLTVCAGI